MKHYAPVWKDGDGNRFVFTNGNMIFKTPDAALHKSNSMFLAMLPAGLFNAGFIEFEMDRKGNIALEGIDANFSLLGHGYLIGGPKFDARVRQDEHNDHAIAQQP